MPDTVVLFLYAVPLALAMGLDAVTFRIPNPLTAAFALAFPAAAALAPAPVDWLSHLGAGALVFAVAAAAFAGGALGGGDVKLLGAAALWLGFGALPDFALLTALYGGALALAVLVARRWTPPLLARLPGCAQPALPRLLSDGEAVPYGLAIGAAGLTLAARLPLLG
ncbi:prepilin peptidase [Azospirillum sp. ST 5-10]|uniref:prepilin peptidase n=1 Tax=unclassified Azospirillum TaxID=2630922 RepID=UPI003F49FCB0